MVNSYLCKHASKPLFKVKAFNGFEAAKMAARFWGFNTIGSISVYKCLDPSKIPILSLNIT
tara:strand:- start:271 stop:453 length:183 start_codon:yes stop_codon:yes gene_type:complete